MRVKKTTGVLFRFAITTALILLPVTLWAQGGGGTGGGGTSGGGVGTGSSSGGGIGIGSGGSSIGGNTSTGQIGDTDPLGTGGAGLGQTGGTSPGSDPTGTGQIGGTSPGRLGGSTDRLGGTGINPQIDPNRGGGIDAGRGPTQPGIPGTSAGARGNLPQGTSPGRTGSPLGGQSDLGLGPNTGSGGQVGGNFGDGRGTGNLGGGSQGLGRTGTTQSGGTGQFGDEGGQQRQANYMGRDRERPALGLRVGRDPQGRVLVSDVRPNSPAALAGLQPGDEMVAVGNTPIQSTDDVVAAIRNHRIGEQVNLQFRRDGQVLTAIGRLESYVSFFGSSDLMQGENRPALGVRVRESSGGRLEVTEVEPNSPAAAAGIRTGDQILAVGNAPVRNFNDLVAALGRADVGNQVSLRLMRNAQEMSTVAEVTSYAIAFGGGGTLPGGTEREVMRQPLEEPPTGATRQRGPGQDNQPRQPETRQPVNEEPVPPSQQTTPGGTEGQPAKAKDAAKSKAKTSSGTRSK